MKKMPPSKSRFAFTLVELLVVLSVIATLAAMSVLVIRGTVDTARKSRIKSQIATINEVINQRWRDYEVRLMPVQVAPTMSLADIVRMKNDYKFELVRAEIPDQAVYVSAAAPFPSTGFMSAHGTLIGPLQQANLQARPPSVYRRYKNQVDTKTAEPAELLYLILQSIRVGEQSGVDLMRRDEIVDSDGDGLYEVVDSYGEPLIFEIRYDNAPIDLDTAAGMNFDFEKLRFHVESSRLDPDAT